MPTSYTSNRKPSALTAAAALGDADTLVVEQSGDVLKTTMSAVETKVFSAKAQTISAPSGSEVVVVRDGSTPKNIALSNIVPNGNINNDKVAANAGIADSKLAQIATPGKVANAATTATADNNPSTIVLRDGSGNFAAGNITVASITATTINGTLGNITGNIPTTNSANTANAWTTPRNLELTQDVTATFTNVDGSAAVSAAATLANSGVSAGTYNDNAAQVRPFTVDAKGRLTAIGTAVDISIDQSAVTGSSERKHVRVATTANLAVATPVNTGTLGVGATLISQSVGALSIDGVSPIVGDRVLVKDQTTGSQNGIYAVTDVGSASTTWTLTRATDADTAEEAAAIIVSVQQGTNNGGKTFKSTFKSSDTVGTAAQNIRELVPFGQPGYLYAQTLTYAVAGTSTFTKATYPWLRALRVRCQGGGGGGGGPGGTGASSVSIGGAGGGGGYAESFITDIAGLDASVTITVGAGGSGGSSAAGSNGGSSSFGALVSANGGNGGSYNAGGVSTASVVVGSEGGSGTGNLVVKG